MSTHNIGFYEEISKIITKLSSNIIKYAPYFFQSIYMYVYVEKVGNELSNERNLVTEVFFAVF